MMILRACVASCLVLAACTVGEVGAGGGGTDAGVDPAARSFDMIVRPRVSRCAVVGCHAGSQAPNLSSYALLDSYYKRKPGRSNILVTKGTMTVPPGEHSSMPYLSADDQAAIAGWIDSL